ncbi:MAG TPA: ScyD/ScyE family protein [Steroidobacteraceae bacterium]|nr:ScyD/ScyE family protein [Steroidobacteraceae bacterium]
MVHRYWLKGFLAVAAGSALAAADASAATPLPAATPVFGLDAAPDGSLLVADAGSGVLELRKGTSAAVASLPGVTAVAALGRGDVFAVTSPGFGGSGHLYRASRGSARMVADISGFEAAVNPDGDQVDSNPFDVAVLNGGQVVVADAAANAIVVADMSGTVDWIATLPDQLVSTANLKQLAGCPDSNAQFCGLPPMLPAEAVATSVALGPDGYLYAGELKGFPAPTGQSRVWRIDPSARHVVCGTSPQCVQVAAGFTSITDLSFGPDGTLYVTEFDEASWAAVEFGLGPVGGTVNACAVSSGACTVVATGLPMPTDVAFRKDGQGAVVINALVPGNAQLQPLP